MAYYDKQAGKVVFGQGNKAPKPYTIDDYIKTNNQFKKGYDANSNTAYLTDTKTGKTLSFLSGQGQEYGFGGIKNGSNVISDLQKLQSFFNTPATPENKGPDIPTLNTMANSNNATNTANTNTFKSDYDPKTLEYLSKMQNRQYTSPYAQNITDTLAKIQNYQNFNYDPNSDQGLQAAQDEAQSATSRAASRRGMLYSDSNKSQMGRAALNLVPQFRNQAYQEYSNDRANVYNQLQALQNLENTAYQRYQGEGADLYNQANLVRGLADTDYNRYNADRSRTDNQYLEQGLVYDPATGQYVKTAATKRQEEIDAQSKADREKNDYISSIQGLGNQFDYQAEINKIANDNDSSNDWKIPYLKQAREAKIQTNFQKDISTIGQYGNDYQAEINRRQSTPDTNDDALIPYLKIAQIEKKSNMQNAQLTQMEKQQKTAFELWKQMGLATPEIANILGVPVGAKTSDYLKTLSDYEYKQGMLANDTRKTNYDVNKPYYNPNTSSKSKEETIKKSPYYDDAYDSISSKISNWESNPAIVVRDSNGQIAKDWIRTPGSVQYNTIVEQVMGDPTLNDYEKYRMLSDFDIPYN